MIVGFAVGAHLVFAVLSAIGNSFDQNRRRRRAECDRKERLRRHLTRPLIEVEAARQSLQEVVAAFSAGPEPLSLSAALKEALEAFSLINLRTAWL